MDIQIKNGLIKVSDIDTGQPFLYNGTLHMRLSKTNIVDYLPDDTIPIARVHNGLVICLEPDVKVYPVSVKVVDA